MHESLKRTEVEGHQSTVHGIELKVEHKWIDGIEIEEEKSVGNLNNDNNLTINKLCTEKRCNHH